MKDLSERDLCGLLHDLGRFTLQGLMPQRAWDSPELERFQMEWRKNTWARIVIRPLDIEQT
eukprot:3576413-Alexandrium_andersonii.AAC.1